MGAGQSFMGRLFHDLLFYPDLPEIFFNTLHVAMFVLVVQGLVMYPPRWFRTSLSFKPLAASRLSGGGTAQPQAAC